MKFCPKCEMRLAKSGSGLRCRKCDYTEGSTSTTKKIQDEKSRLKDEYLGRERERIEKELEKIQERRQEYQTEKLPDLEFFLNKISEFKNMQIRKNQMIIIRKVAQSIKNGYSKIIISAPTGAGKSWIAVALSLAFKSSVILTSTTYLQDQYGNDFGSNSQFLTTVRGKRHFDCERNYRMTDCTHGYCSNCEFKPSPDDIQFKEGSRGTVYEMLENKMIDRSCPYFEQIFKGRKSSFSVYNYDSYISQLKMEEMSVDDESLLPFKQLLICDEMHDYEERLAHSLSTELKPKMDQLIVKNSFTYEDDPAKVLEQIEKLIEAFPEKVKDYNECTQHTLYLLSPDHVKLHNEPCPKHGFRPSKDCKSCMGIRNYIDSKKYLDCREHASCHRDHHQFNHENKRKLEQYISQLKFIHFGLKEYPYNYLINKNKQGNTLIQPINSSWMSRKIFEKFDVKIFMSATANKKLFCMETRFQEDEVDFISVESEIPPKNRMINLRNVCKMTGDSEAWDWGRIVSEIEQILQRHKDEHGIIILTSYKQMHKILELLDDSSRKRLLPTHTIDENFSDKKEKCNECSYPIKNMKDILKSHRSDEIKNSVIISPAIGTGVDLPYEQSRFQIILKVPFQSLGDKRIKYICDNYPERYFLKSLFAFIQNCGRSIRASNDFATTYILDSTAKSFLRRNAGEIPNWFKSALPVSFS